MISDVLCSAIGYNRLRLDGAILETIDNGLLDFDLGTTSRANCARIWNGDVAVDVYSLSRNGNEIAGANTALGGYEQPPGTRLKNCYADNVADAKPNVSWPAPIRKVGDKPRRGLGQDVRDLGRDSDKGIWKFLGSCCPAQTSQLDGPLAGIKAQPPASAPRSGKLKRMPRLRTVAPPRTGDTSSKEYKRSMRLLPLLRIYQNPGRMRPF